MKCLYCNKKLTKWTTDQKETIFDCLNSSSCGTQIIYDSEMKIRQYCLIIDVKGKLGQVLGKGNHTTFFISGRRVITVDLIDIDEDNMETKISDFTNRIGNMLAFI